MFSRSRHHARTNSNPAIDHERDRDVFQKNPGIVAPTPSPMAVESSNGSPLAMTFDFELPPTTPAVTPSSPLRPSHNMSATPSVGNFSRPRTSDGPSPVERTPISLNPPILPPIPRVASRYEKDRDSDNASTTRSSAPRRPMMQSGNTAHDTAYMAERTGTLEPRLSFEHPVDLLSLAPPEKSSPQDPGDGTMHELEDDMPKMASSLFPPRMESAPPPPPPMPPPAPPLTNVPAMTRSFIDSRDKPYSQPPPAPFTRTSNHSTPDLLTPHSAVDVAGRPSTARLKSQQSLHSLSSRTTSAGLSGTTAHASNQPSVLSRANSSTPVITVGTPYSETSASFPAPERVTRRPAGSSATSTVAGVSVPTHFSSSSKVETKSGEVKKKGRLLNPMSVFQRRRSAQDGETVVEERAQRQAQAQALARQKDVVVGGVNKLPVNYDPSIKGKVVHDFSAPRVKRNTFGEIESPAAAQVPISFGTPSPPSDSISARSSSLPNTQTSRENSSRLSARAPIFKEHLNEEADASGRISSIHAENLENKDFLQRASVHSTSNYSQDSAMLPPFARRSQVLDPAQAAFFQDSDSKRSSDRSVDKDQATVSPMATPHEQNFTIDPRRSVSPISTTNSTRRPPGPTSPALTNTFSSQDPSGSTPSGSTPKPVSGVLAPPRNEYLSESIQHGSPMAVSPVEPLTPTRLPNHPDSSQPSPLQLTPPDHEAPIPISTHSKPPSAEGLTPAKKFTLDQTAGFPTPDRTPEPPGRVIQPARLPSQAKIAEKRTSAGGRSKRAFSGPRHHASTASRFSFQYASGESAAEEHALEDKHRNLVKRGQIPADVARGPSPDEEEEDYFDEDAMDDMDEMEMEDHDFHDQFPIPNMPPPPTQSLPTMQQARQMLQAPESDDSDTHHDGDDVLDTDESQLPYPDHSAFRNHSALNSPHTSLRPGTPDGYWRGSTIDHYMRDSVVPQRPRNISGASALTINTNVGPFSNAGVPKPHPSNSNTVPLQRNDHSRVVSGMSFSSASDVTRSPPPPPRAASGSWALRSVAPVTNPETFLHMDSSTSDTPRSVSGLSSSRSAESSSTQGTLTGGRRSLERHFKYPSPALSNQSAGEDSITTVDTSSSPLPRTLEKRPIAGLGLNARTNFDFDDSPTIPFNHIPLRAAGTTHKSGLSTSTVPSDLQANTRWNNQAIQSPPATVELVNNGFDLNVHPHHVPDSQSRHGSWQNRSQLLTSASSSGSENQTSPEKPVISGNAFNSFNFYDPGSPVNDAHVIPIVQGSPSAVEDHVASHASNLSPGGSSAIYQGDVGRGLQVRSPNFFTQPPQQTQRSMMDGGNDDMYYDDGNFDDEDITDDLHGEGIDENAFDDDTFLRDGTKHRRDNSALTVSSVGSDGPYPSFAMPNAAKAKERDARMMLEDLPLQTSVDPQFIPRRNPSEDAKRLGLSNKAPPLPVPASDAEAYSHMQTNLQHYHAALADAANKAAADGRFLRVASVSTARAPSGASSKFADDDRSQYSRDYEGNLLDARDDHDKLSPGKNGVGRSASNQTTSTQFTQQSYSPQKLNFDFGFDQAPTDDGDLDDEDLVAAANADVLASDDEGFYGQEFRFYGRPRSNSGEVEALHGGYFGEDGDDGLTRNRSLKEPNLTPITERSEFSTRNSFIGLGQPYSAGAPPSAGPFGPHSPALARVPVSPWTDNDITSFEQLRKLRANAFAGSTTSLNSSNRSSAHSASGFTVGNNPSGYSPNTTHAILASGARPNYLGGAPPMAYGSSNDSSNSSNPPAMHPVGSTSSIPLFESPLSIALANESYDPTDTSLLATPKRPTHHSRTSSAGAAGERLPDTPPTARRISTQGGGGGAMMASSSSPSQTHSRKSSSNSNGGMGGSADSVTYVREPDPEGNGKPRWVLERRRTSSQGQLELVGRELVQGGWI